METSESVERTLPSWVATQQGDGLSIQGVVRYPNRSSTAGLRLVPATAGAAAAPCFVLSFGRDKEPYCWPNLVGEVAFHGGGFPAGLKEVIVMDGDTRLVIPVRSA